MFKFLSNFVKIGIGDWGLGIWGLGGGGQAPKPKTQTKNPKHQKINLNYIN